MINDSATQNLAGFIPCGFPRFHVATPALYLLIFPCVAGTGHRKNPLSNPGRFSGFRIYTIKRKKTAGGWRAGQILKGSGYAWIRGAGVMIGHRMLLLQPVIVPPDARFPVMTENGKGWRPGRDMPAGKREGKKGREQKPEKCTCWSAIRNPIMMFIESQIIQISIKTTDNVVADMGT